MLDYEYVGLGSGTSLAIWPQESFRLCIDFVRFRQFTTNQKISNQFVFDVSVVGLSQSKEAHGK